MQEELKLLPCRPMPAPDPIIIDIAARVGPGYGLGAEVAQSLVRKVLAIYAAKYAGSKAEEKATENGLSPMTP